jgi:hypothetical protein
MVGSFIGPSNFLGNLLYWYKRVMRRGKLKKETTQLPKEKAQRDKQRSTKHYTEN